MCTELAPRYYTSNKSQSKKPLLLSLNFPQNRKNTLNIIWATLPAKNLAPYIQKWLRLRLAIYPNTTQKRPSPHGEKTSTTPSSCYYSRIYFQSVLPEVVRSIHIPPSILSLVPRSRSCYVLKLLGITPKYSYTSILRPVRWCTRPFVWHLQSFEKSFREGSQLLLNSSAA